MNHQFAEIMFTESVKNAQEHYGSREHNERFAGIAGPNDALTEREVSFINQRDSFYMATVNEDGWPYVQHRGGPPGFLQVIDAGRLAYADYRGNTQLISVGNANSNDRVSIIMMDYPNRRRLKILGRIRFVNACDLGEHELNKFEQENYRAQVERIVYIDLEAFDWNCPQHITRRYTEHEYEKLER